MKLYLLATSQSGLISSAPVNSTLPSITGVVQQGAVLTANRGVWFGSPSPTFAIEWQTSADGSTGWTDLFGPSATYTPVSGDVGKFLRAAVTASNGVGSPVTAFSASTIAVAGPTGTLPFNQASNGLGSQWSEIFAEEFTSALDLTRWTPYWFSNLTPIPGGPTPGASANVTVSGGKAHLLYDGTNGALISTNPADGVTAHTGFAFTYGYAEVSLTVPNDGAGRIAQWPGVVLFGQSWPFTGEVDFMEGLAGDNWLHYHYGPVGGPELTPIGGMNNTSPLTGAHIYGVNWQPGRLDFYVDGTLVRTTQNSNLVAGNAITSSPLYLALMFRAGGVGGGVGTPPLTMDVDYVRVWQAIVTPAAPVNTAVPTVSGTAQVGLPLSATTGAWTGSPAPTFSYQWQKSADGSTGWASVAGGALGQSAFYTVQSSDGGNFLRVAVTAANAVAPGGVTANSASAIPQVASLSAPVNTVLPAISGTPTQGQVLTAAPGTWTGNPVPTFGYQWQTSATGTGGWSNIGGATSNAYTLVLGDVAQFLRCVVTGSNSVTPGGVAANTASTVAIAASGGGAAPPVNTALPSITDMTPTQGETLTGNQGTWTGNPAPTFPTFAWQRSPDGSTGWIAVAGIGGGGSTYTPVSADVGYFLRLVVTAANPSAVYPPGVVAISPVTSAVTAAVTPPVPVPPIPVIA